MEDNNINKVMVLQLDSLKRITNKRITNNRATRHKDNISNLHTRISHRNSTVTDSNRSKAMDARRSKVATHSSKEVIRSNKGTTLNNQVVIRPEKAATPNRQVATRHNKEVTDSGPF